MYAAGMFTYDSEGTIYIYIYITDTKEINKTKDRNKATTADNF